MRKILTLIFLITLSSNVFGEVNNETKRESVKELVERMTNRLDLYQADLMNLLLVVTDLTNFLQLEFCDENGRKELF